MAQFNRYITDEDGNKHVVRSKEYWARRSEWIEQNTMKDVDRIDRWLQHGYNGIMQDIERDIEQFLIRNKTVADINKPVSVKEYLTTMDDLFKQLNNLNKSNQNPQVKKRLEKQLKSMIDLQNKRFKRTRLEVLHKQIEGKVLQHGVKMHNTTYKGLQDVFLNTYDRKQFEIQRGVGYGYQYTTPNFDTIDKAILYPWAKDGLMFSDRIWNYVDKEATNFTKAIRRTIASDIITMGKHPKTVAKNLVGFGHPDLSPSTLRYNSTRLLYTEASHVMAEAEAEVSMEWGITYYFYLATFDDRTSEICGELDGQRFEYKNRQAGTNFPPMHPNCRSTTYDDIKNNLYDKRGARDLTGKGIDYVPYDVTYKQWKKWQQTGKKPWEDSKQKKPTINSLVDRLKKEVPQIKNINLDGVPVDVAERNIEQFIKLDKMFHHDIHTIGTNATGCSIAWVERFRGQRPAIMELNKKYFKSKKALVKSHSYSDDMFERWHVHVSNGSEDIATITHEFAHAITSSHLDKFGFMDVGFWKEIRSAKNSYSRSLTALDKKLRVTKKLTHDEWKKEKGALMLSEYAKKNVDEFFAEAFCNGMLSDNPTPAGLKVVEIAKRYFGKGI